MTLCGLLFASCSDDENDFAESDSTTPIYQQYEIDFYPTFQNVFANFSNNDKNGTKVKLANGASIKVNSSAMNFTEDDSSTGGWNYYKMMQQKEENISLTFKRNNNSEYVNTVSRSEIGEVKMPTTLTTIYNGVPFSVEYDFTRMQGNEELECTLRQSSGTNAGVIYTGFINQMNGTITFTDVPEGSYTLQVMTKRTMATSENNLPASGEITLYYVDYKTVSVK